MSRYLAIDPDIYGLTVCSGTTRGSSIRLDQTVFLRDENLQLSPSTAKSLGNRLKDALNQAGIAPAPVLLIVARERVVLKDIRHPPASGADEPAIVRFQAIKELADAPEDVIIDYTPVGEADPTTGERRALVATLRRDMLAAAKIMCETAGLKLAGITPRPFAISAAVQRAISTGAAPAFESANDTIAALSITEKSGEFTVIRAGQVRFSRTIPSLSLASEEAFVSELGRNLTVYSAQPGSDDIRAIYLAEAEAGAGGWAGRLQSALPVPVYSYDPVAGARAADLIPPELRGRFAGVVGVIAARASGQLPINFVQPRQPRADADPKKARKLAAILLGLILVFGGGILSFFYVDSEERRLKNLQNEVASLDAQLKDMEPDVKRLAAAEEFLNREVHWLDDFYDISERFPDINKMRVLSLKGTSLPLPTDKERQAQAALPVSKNAPRKPVAKLELTIAAPNGELPDQLIRQLDQRYYLASRMKIGPIIPGGSEKNKQQQFTIESGIVHRGPTEYTRKLSAVMPKVIETPTQSSEQDVKTKVEIDANEGDSNP